MDEIRTMKAMVQHEYGEAEDVMALEEIAIPEIEDDQVLIRVHSAGVDRGVLHLVAGLPYPVRLVFGLTAPKKKVLGFDVAGTIEAVGSEVTTFKPGDPVFGIANGSFAEYACARAGKIVSKPESLGYEQAAALSISGLTALQGIRDHGQVQPGQKVLITGASGGVGSFSIQIAKAFGAEVTGLASTGKLDFLRSLGADHVLDYTCQDFTEGPDLFDLILDIAGNRSISDMRRVLAPDGRLIIVGGETGGKWLNGMGRQLRAILFSPFIGQKLGTFVSPEKGEDILTLREMVVAGQISPVIDRSFELEEVPSAIRYLAEGRARGKVTIAV